MRASLVALSLLASAHVVAQINPTDAMVYGYTDYYSDTWYGFPASIGFADSHSGWLASWLGPGVGPIRIDNSFGPTDESPNCNTDIWITFNVVQDTLVQLDTGTTAYIEYNWGIYDENFNTVASYDGGLSNTILLPAGNYTLTMNSFMNMWWAGTSYGQGWLDVFERGYGLRPDAYAIQAGEEFSGDVDSLDLSDDTYLQVLNDPDTLVARIKFDTVSPVANPSSFSFHFEGKVARPGLSQTITLRNYDLSQDVVVSGRVATQEDSTVDVELATALAEYVGNGGVISASVEWSPINDEDPSLDGWLHSVDRAYWWLDK